MSAITKALEKFVRLSLRERILVVLAGMVAVYFLIDALLLTPQQKRIKQLQTAVQTARAEKETLTAEIIKMEAQQAAGKNPLATQQAEIAEWKRQVALAESFYSDSGARGAGLKTLLDELLKNNPQVTLASLRSIPASEFVAPGSATRGAARAVPVVYRSGVEVTLRGSYFALLDYLRRLEQGSNRLFWADARLDASSYPQASLRLTINTLGEDAGVAMR